MSNSLELKLAKTPLVLGPMPIAHIGAGALSKLAGAVYDAAGRPNGSITALIVTDKGLAGTPIVPLVRRMLAAGGIETAVFDGVHPNPTTDDIAKGAAVAMGPPKRRPVVIVAVGGGSAIDAAKGIAVAAVNRQRGWDLDYSNTFEHLPVPIVAVVTTAGTGAETATFGVVTHSATRRKFYVGHAGTIPYAAILDPDLTIGLPPGITAATGMDALVHALESYMSLRANHWSDPIAMEVIKMVTTYLPRAFTNGADEEARHQMLLASHMAGRGMATTGLGLCHAIAHALGGQYDIPHGVALSMVLPEVLRFNLSVCEARLAAVASACGVGDTDATTKWNANEAVNAISALPGQLGMTDGLSAHGVTAADFSLIAEVALADPVILNTPRAANKAAVIDMLSRTYSKA